jgi:hypothetical protein
LKPSFPLADSELLDSLVGGCKRLGVFYYPNIPAQYHPEGVAPYAWLSVDRVKRFNLALYKAYKMLSRVGTRDSALDGCGVTRIVSGALTATDLQFLMPTKHALWDAVSK